jgi:hypothetical protein
VADITVLPAQVRPLPGCIIRRFAAGGVVTVGNPVYLSAADTVDEADGSATSTSFAIGVVVAVGATGATASVAGDTVDVVLFGPVAGYSTNMAQNILLYVDDDPGIMSTTAGTKSTVVGIGLSAEVLLVNPHYAALS